MILGLVCCGIEKDIPVIISLSDEERERLKALYTWKQKPTTDELKARSRDVIGMAVERGVDSVLLSLKIAPFMISYLEAECRRNNISVFYALWDRFVQKDSSGIIIGSREVFAGLIKAGE